MNFEERLAQTQAKLDELKAKINDSIESSKKAYEMNKKEALIKIAKMDAAIEDFGRDVEAQVLCDVTAMKDEVNADKAALAADKEARIEKAEARAEKVDAALNEFDAKVDAKIAADAAKYDTAAEKIQNKIDDQLDTAEGDLNAAQEDIRIAKERYAGKLNSRRLELQMRQEAVKDKIEAHKTAVDKSAQEELIMDFLDYADYCQMIAYAYAMEAELAILDACDEIEDYESKYGKMENEEA